MFKKKSHLFFKKTPKQDLCKKVNQAQKGVYDII